MSELKTQLKLVTSMELVEGSEDRSDDSLAFSGADCTESALDSDVTVTLLVLDAAREF